MAENAPYLTLIIPAFNEEARIADTLYTVVDYLKKQSYESEVIVVDDGSCDLTAEVVRVIDSYAQVFNDQQPIRLMENIKNVGKGFSIARAMVQARGEIVLFSDADLSTPIEEVEAMIPAVEAGYDLIIGSRHHADAQAEAKPLLRRMMSRGWQLALSLAGVRGYGDTQCGFKIYRREAAHTLALLQKSYGFAFDVEHLYLARKLGYRVKEVGVRWVHCEGSKVDPVRDSLGMLFEVLRIRFLHRNLSLPEGAAPP